MDHSLYGYLSRRTDQELQAILQYYSREENIKEYYYIIPEIIKIMEEREKSVPNDCSFLDKVLFWKYNSLN